MKIKAKKQVYEPLTQEKLDALLKAGEIKKSREGYASKLVVFKNERKVLILFNDGSGFLLNVDDYDEFKNMSGEELDNLSIGFSGNAICHNELDIHVSIQGLVEKSGGFESALNLTSVLKNPKKANKKIKASNEYSLKNGRMLKKKTSYLVAYMKKVKHES
ncbi:TPA: DUF2442 domain-containing protein [Klebsiella aerogenes]|nr:DUF2442 domain-containing protein [Klebsiella aerogenes]